MTEPRKRRRWLKRLILLLGLLILSTIGFAVCEHLRGRSMLTRRVAQLKAAGEELNVTAFLPQPVEPDRNAFTLLATLTNRTESILTNASSGPSTMEFIEPGKAAVAWKLTHWDFGEGVTNDWNWLAYQLNDARELIAQLHAAASRPAYSCGFDYNKGFLDFQIGPLHTVKQAVQVLSAATIYELHRGDSTAAHSNLCALVNLVVMQEPEPLVICQLIRFACATIAFNTTWGVLQSQDLTEAQLAKLQALWDRARFAEDMGRALEMERAMGMAYGDRLRNSSKNLEFALNEQEDVIEMMGNALGSLPARGFVLHQLYAPLWRFAWSSQDQASRIRIALEQFMCRGETVTGAELQDLMKHPLLAPMLGGLVLVGDGALGYPVHEGKALQDHSGNKEALKKDEEIRIAHPVDLLPAAKWHAWQKDCFARERIQPFKQVFRELYTLTKPEKDEGAQSRRYAGHQVQPRKAMALLGARGWVHHPEEGVRKTYHDEGVTVWLGFAEPFYTPAEIEGLTLETVHFTKRGGDSKPLKLTGLPPRLFSETMRDLDLVVSVAHRGGVDPEASASTLEMRAALVKETCALLKLSNVRIKDNSVLIKGELGEYSVHLGSAIARKIPGETLFIVAVQAQHRGRLFLPFADNDPRTAEVVSKVLLLARDKEIKDPSIVSQIRAG